MLAPYYGVKYTILFPIRKAQRKQFFCIFKKFFGLKPKCNTLDSSVLYFSLQQ